MPTQQQLKFSTKKSTKPKKKVKKGGKPKHYGKLKRPNHPLAAGLFTLKAKARADKTLGKLCLICKAKLKYKSGRPPVICPEKESCFRAYRNYYRRDYDKAVAA